MGIEKSIEAGKRNFAEANARKAAACAPRRAAEQLAREERQRRILIKRLHRAMKSYAKAVEKEILKNQHGTSIGDYDRCRKNNRTACKPCKAGAAAYMRVKNKEPKYKAKEKEYYKNNPHKRPPRSRDRARIKGQNVVTTPVSIYLTVMATIAISAILQLT